METLLTESMIWEDQAGVVLGFSTHPGPLALRKPLKQRPLAVAIRLHIQSGIGTLYRPAIFRKGGNHDRS
jgi:hypothetical protein